MLKSCCKRYFEGLTPPLFFSRNKNMSYNEVDKTKGDVYMMELTKIKERLQEEIEKINFKIADTKIRIGELELRISANVYNDAQVEVFEDELKLRKKQLKEYKAVHKGFTGIIEGY